MVDGRNSKVVHYFHNDDCKEECPYHCDNFWNLLNDVDSIESKVIHDKTLNFKIGKFELKSTVKKYHFD